MPTKRTSSSPKKTAKPTRKSQAARAFFENFAYYGEAYGATGALGHAGMRHVLIGMLIEEVVGVNTDIGAADTPAKLAAFNKNDESAAMSAEIKSRKVSSPLAKAAQAFYLALVA